MKMKKASNKHVTENLEKKIDKLQNSISKLESKLDDHISFIEKVYEPLRTPISKIKNFFN